MKGTFLGLHVIADDDARWKRDPVSQAEAACMGGAQVIQLRAKTTPDEKTLAWAREIRALTLRFGARFVINDRFDIALASGADGVHLGQSDLAPRSIPVKIRERLAIGRSTHTLEQVEEASAEPIDYLAFGPIFPTRSKESEYDPRGLTQLENAARAASPRPLVAIGGIQPGNLSEVLKRGAKGAAVISATAGSPEPKEATSELVSIFTHEPEAETGA